MRQAQTWKGRKTDDVVTDRQESIFTPHVWILGGISSLVENIQTIQSLC